MEVLYWIIDILCENILCENILNGKQIGKERQTTIVNLLMVHHGLSPIGFQ
ncbi:MAG: hypothetical protein ACI814_001719 [Mariniblastus sp.]|jgi:hypothetical protein